MSFLLLFTIYILFKVFFGSKGLMNVQTGYAKELTFVAVKDNCL